jgi:hypothetical protein
MIMISVIPDSSAVLRAPAMRTHCSEKFNDSYALRLCKYVFSALFYHFKIVPSIALTPLLGVVFTNEPFKPSLRFQIIY